MKRSDRHVKGHGYFRKMKKGLASVITLTAFGVVALSTNVQANEITADNQVQSLDTTTYITADTSGVYSSSSQVVIDNSTQTITFADATVANFTGDASAYSVLVPSTISEAVSIILDNASLNSITFESTGENSLTLAEGTSNELVGTDYGVSSTNLTIDGTGSLTIANAQNYGIVTSDDTTIANGTLDITSAGSGIWVVSSTDPDAANLTIEDGNITITSSTADGTAGIRSGNTLTVNGGDVTVSSSYEAYVASDVVINGGVASLTASDDGIVSKAPFYGTSLQADSVSITINGGTTTVIAAGDGIDSNGDFTVTGGALKAQSTTADNAAIDYDGNGITSGGTTWGIGQQGMAQAFMTGSSQAYIIANISGQAGETITVTDSQGTVIASTTADVAFGNVVLSTEAIVSEGVYTITTSSGVTASATATTETSATVFQPGGEGAFQPGSENGQPTPPTGERPELPTGAEFGQQTPPTGEETGERPELPTGAEFGQQTPPTDEATGILPELPTEVENGQSSQVSGEESSSQSTSSTSSSDATNSESTSSTETVSQTNQEASVGQSESSSQEETAIVETDSSTANTTTTSQSSSDASQSTATETAETESTSQTDKSTGQVTATESKTTTSTSKTGKGASASASSSSSSSSSTVASSSKGDSTKTSTSSSQGSSSTKTLPSTGEVASALTVLGVGATSVGLIGLKRRKK